MLLFLQVLYTLTNWRWVKILLGVFFVIDLVVWALATGLIIGMVPDLINMIQEMINVL